MGHKRTKREREQGRHSGESVRLPPLWPGFDSRNQRHMWVEFFVGSRPCSEGLFSGYMSSGFSSLLKNQHFQIPIRSGIRGPQQPRPQDLLLVQNGGRRNPWPRLLKYSKNHGVFCHVTHDEMAFSEVVSSVRPPCLFSAIGNRCSNETKSFRRVYVTKF